MTFDVTFLDSIDRGLYIISIFVFYTKVSKKKVRKKFYGDIIITLQIFVVIGAEGSIVFFGPEVLYAQRDSLWRMFVRFMYNQILQKYTPFYIENQWKTYVTI